MKTATSIVYLPDHQGTEALAKAELLPKYRRLSLCFLAGCLLCIVAGVMGMSDDLPRFPVFTVGIAGNVLALVGCIYFMRYKKLHTAKQLARTLLYPIEVPKESALVIEMLQQVRLEAAKRRHGVAATMVFNKILRHYCSGEKEQAEKSISILNDLAHN